ncbi:hypothetical protein, conserved [Angomonas deanei]|uniref:Uncharacterized protein n=1 Tax=Angomonas deanei TaxID=59799 RepID=A0A7G2CFB9_9TRYP|nr:hypothetical protein, conserved [Angomonas deanei]
MHTLPDETIEQCPGFLDEMKGILFQGALNTPETHRRIIHVCVGTLVSGFSWNYLPEIMPLVLADPASHGNERALALLELLFTYTQRFRTPLLEDNQVKLEASHSLIPVLHVYLQYHDPRIDRYVFKIMECVVEVALELTKANAPIGPSSFDEWFNIMLKYPDDNYANATQVGGKALEEYTKCVKRIAGISYSLLNDGTRKKKPSPTAAYFTTTYAEQFLLLWNRWLAIQTDVTTRSMYQESHLNALRYIKLSTLDEKMYRTHLRPNALSFIETTLFPFLIYGESDEEVFADEDGLSEYVQMMEESFNNGEFSLRQAASNVILAMIGGKKMHHDSAALLQEILGILTKGLNLEENDANFPFIYGFLHLLSILRKYIKGVDSIWQNDMANVLKSCVSPKLSPSSRYPALRCKALEVCQRYTKVPMSNEDFQQFVAMICGLVEDKDARVRLSAINTVCSLLDTRLARLYLKSFLVPLMEECLLFLNKVHTTFVPTVILHLSTHFAPELGPIMGKLGQTLVQHFLATAFEMNEVEGGDEPDLAMFEQAFFSADALLETINTVVTSCNENEQAFLAMRPDLIRLIQRILQQPDCFDFMEKALCIYLHTVAFSKPIPPELWELLPLLFQTVESGLGVDFFNLVEEVLDNYISGATVEYISNKTLMDATYHMCEKMLIGGVVCATECQVGAAMLIEALLHQAKGSAQPNVFDGELPRFVGVLLQALIHPDIQQGEVSLRIWIIAALMDCFYYNAELTLGVMCNTNAYPQFLDGFFYFFRGCSLGEQEVKKSKKKKGAADETREVVDTLSLLTRKVMVLGLSSLVQYLSTNTQHPAHPSFVESYLSPCLAFIQYCIFTNAKLYEGRCAIAQKNIIAIRNGDEADDVEDGEDGIVGIDDVGADDEAMEDFSDVEDWDETGDDHPFGAEPDEGDDYESPIDEINEVNFFGQYLSQLQQYTPAVQQVVSSVLQSEETFHHASYITDQYRMGCKELEAAMEESYKKRSESI